MKMKLLTGLTPVMIDTTSATISKFCAGMQSSAPAAIMVTRELSDADEDRCSTGGVTDILKAQLGFIALVLVQKKSDENFGLTDEQIYRALANEVSSSGQFVPNTLRTWKDVDSKLPATHIRFFLPSPALGVRNVFDAEAMVGGCRKIPEIKLIFDAAYRVLKCTTLRRSLVTEIDNPAQRLEAFRGSAPGSIALVASVAYSMNSSWLRLIPFNGFEPTPGNVYSDDYTLATPVVLYVKSKYVLPSRDQKIHNQTLVAWLNEALSEGALGQGGYLEQEGLIPMPAAKRRSQRESVIPN